MLIRGVVGPVRRLCSSARSVASNNTYIFFWLPRPWSGPAPQSARYQKHHGTSPSVRRVLTCHSTPAHPPQDLRREIAGACCRRLGHHGRLVQAGSMLRFDARILSRVKLGVHDEKTHTTAIERSTNDACGSYAYLPPDIVRTCKPTEAQEDGNWVSGNVGVKEFVGWPHTLLFLRGTSGRKSTQVVCIMSGPLVCYTEDDDNAVDVDDIGVSAADTPRDGQLTDIAVVKHAMPVLTRCREARSWQTGPALPDGAKRIRGDEGVSFHTLSSGG